METGVSRVERVANGGMRLVLDRGEALEAELAVLALSVPALRRVVASSPDLADGAWRARVEKADVTLPFSVLRLWLDQPVREDRAPFVGTAGLGILDNISVYERFEAESRAWAERSKGSVVELHAYAVPESMGEAEVRTALVRELHALYPETKSARILEDRFLSRRDCPSFAPGTWKDRLEVTTPFEGVCLAGDFVKTPFPSALMERAAATGFLAANALLGRYDVREEPLWSVPPRGTRWGRVFRF
jgi:isorenieratene synthase